MMHLINEISLKHYKKMASSFAKRDFLIEKNFGKQDTLPDEIATKIAEAQAECDLEKEVIRRCRKLYCILEDNPILVMLLIESLSPDKEDIDNYTILSKEDNIIFNEILSKWLKDYK